MPRHEASERHQRANSHYCQTFFKCVPLSSLVPRDDKREGVFFFFLQPRKMQPFFLSCRGTRHLRDINVQTPTIVKHSSSASLSAPSCLGMTNERGCSSFSCNRAKCNP